MSSADGAPSPEQSKSFGLSAEQQDTAALLDRLLGKSISDRYVDFCGLSAGGFALRVASPLAGHALRELDSILRQTLSRPFEAVPEPTDEEKKELEDALSALKALGFDSDAAAKATRELKRVSHKDQIRKIVSNLGLAEDGDIAKAWIDLSDAHKKAHERPLNRTLAIDDEFRSEWADPFQMVVRGVAVALQGRYATWMARVEELAHMSDKAGALYQFEKEIPGAMPLQWHFFRTISGPGWLPELLKRGLIAEPIPYAPDSKPLLRQWPVGLYLREMAKSDDAKTRELVVAALRPLAASTHPDVRRDGLEILATLPGKDAAQAADIAAAWLTDDSFFFGTLHAEQLMTRLMEAGEYAACMTVVRALYRVFERGGNVATLFSPHMYEHSLFKMTPALAGGLDIEALTLFCDLLYQAAVISKKIETDPPWDHTSYSSIPLPETEADQHDVYGALTCAVLRSSSQLIEDASVDGKAVASVLLSRPYRINKRIALRALARRPQAASDDTDALLFELELLDSGSFAHDYAALAIARFPSMSADKQATLLRLIDEIPGKHLDLWRKWFEEHQKRPPSADDERDYMGATIRDLTWRWRSVLPQDRQRALAEIVTRIGDPDSSWNRFVEQGEESPFTAADFSAKSVKDIAAYLKSWSPEQAAGRQTKTALSFELRRVVQENLRKFSEGAAEFADLPPLYVRRLFEGLNTVSLAKSDVDWDALLGLIEIVIGRAEPPAPGELSEGGDDPTWFWAAKEAITLLRSSLQRGEELIGLEQAERLKSIIRLVEQIAPDRPELADFEERYERSAYFGAEATMFGLAAELNVHFVRWLSRNEGSEIFARPREALATLAAFGQFAERALAHNRENGRIVRAIFGRYFSWLLYFGSDWVQANFSKLFPGTWELREAAWLGYLLYDNRPARDFVGEMRPLYQGEIARLKDAAPVEGKGSRQDRLGEYLMVLHLWGVLPGDLLQSFLRNASSRLRRHVMRFLGHDLRSADMPPEVRARALAYWEMRLAAAAAASNKDDYREELGVISNWDAVAKIDAEWLIAQQVKMFRAGFAPNHSFSVIEWASKVAAENPDGAVELLEALFKNPRTDQWAYMAQQSAVRTILTAGLASAKSETHERVRTIVSLLASMGETSFLDLVR